MTEQFELGSVPHDTAKGGLIIDRRSREVTLDGELIDVTRTEFDLLDLLSRHPRQVFTSRQIFDSLWQSSWFDGDHVIESHISRLRRKLGESATEPRFIHTVRGVGYRFEPENVGCLGLPGPWASNSEARPADGGMVAILTPDLTIIHLSEPLMSALGSDGEDLLGLQAKVLVEVLSEIPRLTIEARAVMDPSGALASIHLRLLPPQTIGVG